MNANLLLDGNTLIETELAVIMILLLIRELRRDTGISGISEDSSISESMGRRTRGFKDFNEHIEW